MYVHVVRFTDATGERVQQLSRAYDVHNYRART
jgi:hypothetical protein